MPGHKIHKRRMIGVVTSDKMNKTRVVMVERRVSDPKYGKYLTSRTKYNAHDEKNEFKSGDRVQIVESRPLSRDQREFRLQEALKNLPEESQQALRLRYVEGLPSKEIAARLGCQPLAGRADSIETGRLRTAAS